MLKEVFFKISVSTSKDVESLLKKCRESSGILKEACKGNSSKNFICERVLKIHKLKWPKSLNKGICSTILMNIIRACKHETVDKSRGKLFELTSEVLRKLIEQSDNGVDSDMLLFLFHNGHIIFDKGSLTLTGSTTKLSVTAEASKQFMGYLVYDFVDNLADSDLEHVEQLLSSGDSLF